MEGQQYRLYFYNAKYTPLQHSVWTGFMHFKCTKSVFIQLPLFIYNLSLHTLQNYCHLYSANTKLWQIFEAQWQGKCLTLQFQLEFYHTLLIFKGASPRLYKDLAWRNDWASLHSCVDRDCRERKEHIWLALLDKDWVDQVGSTCLGQRGSQSRLSNYFQWLLQFNILGSFPCRLIIK